MLTLFRGVLDGPGEGPRPPSLADLVLVIPKALPGEGNDVRRGRGRGLSGGIVEVKGKVEVEGAMEEGGVTERSSEELEPKDRRWLKLAPSRSVSEPDMTCSSSSW